MVKNINHPRRFFLSYIISPAPFPRPTEARVEAPR
jgi:hypothetical protein